MHMSRHIMWLQVLNIVDKLLLNDTNLTLSENAMMLRLAINLIGDVH